jgi:MFS family permease
VVFSYVGVLSVLMRSLILGPAIKYFGELRGMRVGLVVLIVGLLCYPLATHIWQLALVIPLVPIGTALVFPTTTSLMSRYSNPADIGTTMGVAQTYGGIARATAPLISTFVYQHVSHGAPFLMGAGLVALVGLIAVRLDLGPVPGPSPLGDRV